MTTREKVLLSLCGVAAIGGGIYLTASLNSRAKKDVPAAGPKDYTGLITKVQVGIKTGQLTARENGVLQAASTPWLRNPLRSTPLEAIKPEEESKVVLPKYVGYINIADRPIAIIEGVDYRVGDILDGGIFKHSLCTMLKGIFQQDDK